MGLRPADVSTFSWRDSWPRSARVQRSGGLEKWPVQVDYRLHGGGPPRGGCLAAADAHSCPLGRAARKSG